MANIKISELNELTQIETGDVLPIVDISANETKKISINNLNPIDIEMSDTSTNSVENKVVKEYVDNEIEIVNNKIAEIGTQKNGFGDLLTTDGTYSADYYAKIVGTYIGNNTWKLEIEGQILNNNAGSNYFAWGISIDKINTLLDLNLRNYSNTEQASSYNFFTSTGSLDMTVNGISTLFEYKSNINALLPTRIYNSSGASGGWGLDTFTNGSILKTVIYLEESE